MTLADLPKIKGFSDWVNAKESRQFLPLLAEVIDHEVGDTGIAQLSDVAAHINLGIQDATRRIVKIVRNPMAVDAPPLPTPPASYGVKPPTA